jgi:hypothetical protein
MLCYAMLCYAMLCDAMHVESSVFRICDIFIRIRILGSVHGIPDPDPALFSSGFLFSNKNKFFLNYFCFFLIVSSSTPVFKDNM